MASPNIFILMNLSISEGSLMRPFSPSFSMNILSEG